MLYRKEAIRKKCLECSAGSTKEVLLCHLFDCPLWEWRTGCYIKSNNYKRRIRNAFKCYKKDFNRLKQEGFDVKRFLAG